MLSSRQDVEKQMSPSNTPMDLSLPLYNHVRAQPGKVVIVLSGRFAGKKAVIVKSHDEGTSSKSFGHALLVGLSKEPRKVRAEEHQEALNAVLGG